MTTNEWLVGRFEENREYLRTVAYRMLGSMTEAEDAVQESWIRLNRADTSGVENLNGWLTTVVSRVCLDILRSRRSRREDPLDVDEHDALPSRDEPLDPERAREYVLGYTSDNTKRDGRFRRITVQLRNPELRVRHRKGYDALKDEDLKAEKR